VHLVAAVVATGLLVKLSLIEQSVKKAAAVLVDLLTRATNSQVLKAELELQILVVAEVLLVNMSVLVALAVQEL
jgi:hypothetical protein